MISNVSELLEVASREAEFLNMTLDEALNRTWKKELTGVALTEDFKGSRIIRILDAITSNDKKTLRILADQIVLDEEY